MPTSLSPTDLCNVALSKIGSLPINSLIDTTNPSALACNTNYNLCVLEVARSARWNCILDTAILTQVPQVPLPPFSPIPPPVTWEPHTFYAANTYFTYGGYYYITLIDYTSTTNFVVDLTANFFAQTNLPTDQPFFPTGGSQYPSGWAFAYALPTDYQLICALNDNTCPGLWGSYGNTTANYEIIGPLLYCDESQAVIQYVKNQPDSSRFDSLFTNALTLKLAATISTRLRSDGGRLEQELLGEYRRALREARTKNSGERQPRRFNQIASSKFNAARYGGVNG